MELSDSCAALIKEANSIIEQISSEKTTHLLSYRKGFRLIIIGTELKNDSFIAQGEKYLKSLNIKGF